MVRIEAQSRLAAHRRGATALKLVVKNGFLEAVDVEPSLTRARSDGDLLGPSGRRSAVRAGDVAPLAPCRASPLSNPRTASTLIQDSHGSVGGLAGVAEDSQRGVEGWPEAPSGAAYAPLSARAVSAIGTQTDEHVEDIICPTCDSVGVLHACGHWQCTTLTCRPTWYQRLEATKWLLPRTRTRMVDEQFFKTRERCSACRPEGRCLKGACPRYCNFVFRRGTCRFGANCNFCHLHEPSGELKDEVKGAADIPQPPCCSHLPPPRPGLPLTLIKPVYKGFSATFNGMESPSASSPRPDEARPYGAPWSMDAWKPEQLWAMELVLEPPPGATASAPDSEGACGGRRKRKRTRTAADDSGRRPRGGLTRFCHRALVEEAAARGIPTEGSLRLRLIADIREHDAKVLIELVEEATSTGGGSTRSNLSPGVVAELREHGAGIKHMTFKDIIQEAQARGMSTKSGRKSWDQLLEEICESRRKDFHKPCAEELTKGSAAIPQGGGWSWGGAGVQASQVGSE
ncbi:unnamed protein product [Prorocentrum cordatum]|uniref:C3H1-type domain-containing protein n=1 Tax=Prorocentrum cordatum TaxID=2364126 RepID=A0ABN9S1A8_9DINO|nr:unnamed protein product [Polarella glacialis]